VKDGCGAATARGTRGANAGWRLLRQADARRPQVDRRDSIVDLENQRRERRVVPQAHATSATHHGHGYHDQHDQQNRDQYRHDKPANVKVRAQDILRDGRGRIKTPSSARVTPSSR
jgi:hypothetical protein